MHRITCVWKLNPQINARTKKTKNPEGKNNKKRPPRICKIKSDLSGYERCRLNTEHWINRKTDYNKHKRKNRDSCPISLREAMEATLRSQARYGRQKILMTSFIMLKWAKNLKFHCFPRKAIKNEASFLEKKLLSQKFLFYPKYSKNYGLNDIFDKKNLIVLKMCQFLWHLTVRNAIMLKVWKFLGVNFFFIWKLSKS